MWLYLITCLDAIVIVSGILAVVTAICSIIIWACYADEVYSYHRSTPNLKKFGRLTTILAVILILLSCFTPTTKQAAFIYIGNKTINYIEGNEKTKQLPDKVIDLADKYLSNALKE
ncbi:MAG: hypothetical protein MJ224_06395 [archaeon]|nr:hypothetical protein [archaeon]